FSPLSRNYLTLDELMKEAQQRLEDAHQDVVFKINFDPRLGSRLVYFPDYITSMEDFSLWLAEEFPHRKPCWSIYSTDSPFLRRFEADATGAGHFIEPSYLEKHSNAKWVFSCSLRGEGFPDGEAG